MGGPIIAWPVGVDLAPVQKAEAVTARPLWIVAVVFMIVVSCFAGWGYAWFVVAQQQRSDVVAWRETGIAAVKDSGLLDFVRRRGAEVDNLDKEKKGRKGMVAQ